MAEDKGQEVPEIVLKVWMHCEACAKRLERFLKGFEGVEGVSTDYKNNKVMVKGKTADPIKLSQRLQKKCGRNVELISPSPKPSELQHAKPEAKKEVKERPADEIITVTLTIQMHCEACAQVLRKRICRIKGVESVETKLGTSEVVVKGAIDPAKLVDDIYKRARKQASIAKKEEEEEKGVENEGERREDKDEEEEMKSEMKPNQYWTFTSDSDYAYNYPPQIFSDENPNACSLV